MFHAIKIAYLIDFLNFLLKKVDYASNNFQLTEIKFSEEDLEKECKNNDDLFKKILEGSGKMILLDKFIDKYK